VREEVSKRFMVYDLCSEFAKNWRQVVAGSVVKADGIIESSESQGYLKKPVE